MDFDLGGLIGDGAGSDRPRPRARGGSNAGRNIHDHYELVGELGKGSYGVVSKAKHRISGEEFAVKQINKKAAGSKGLSSVFSEVEILSVLHHPSIVHLEETFEDSQNLWLVLEYVAGGELDAELRKHGFFPEGTVRRIIGHLLLAMEHIHMKGIVHRDLKPANMLVSGRLAEGGNCELKLADFGFSTVTSNEATLTSFCGTTAFMAPEILIDAPYGKPVDMWAIGVITYLLVCGGVPFVGSSESEVADSICECQYGFPSKRADGGALPSDGCKDFIKRLLVGEPAARLSATEALHHWWIHGNSGEVELDFYGADDVGTPGAGQAAGVTGRKHPRLRWRKTGLFLRAAHRLLFWQRSKQLVEEQCGIPLFKSLTYLVGGHVEPADGQILAAGLLPTAKGIQRVCDVIEQSRTVEIADLSGNNLSYESLQLVVRAASAAPRLTSLSLSNNPINTLGGRALMRLARGGKLRQLQLRNTQVSAEVLAQIDQALKDNDRSDRAPAARHGARQSRTQPTPLTAGMRPSQAAAVPSRSPVATAAGAARSSAGRSTGAPSLFGGGGGGGGGGGARGSTIRPSPPSTTSLPRIGGGGVTAKARTSASPPLADRPHRQSGAGRK
eukprot:TRINITY_DN6313_c1_g2_i1.p1 TRINITY_DN6313_c1_g2~~TRINITY_DN6313_c1_g2_i1.p1  ORF type:complete len:615 (+),score=137.99 TRINITY_DN6313_c1_g2_i1:190-2034(+)